MKYLLPFIVALSPLVIPSHSEAGLIFRRRSSHRSYSAAPKAGNPADKAPALRRECTVDPLTGRKSCRLVPVR